MIHGRQQQTAMPIMHASATQNTTKKTSKARKIIHSLQNKLILSKVIETVDLQV